MTTINLDFSNIQDETQLEGGIYSAQVVDMYEGVTKNGNPKVTIVYALLDEEVEGRKVYADYVLTPKALPYLRRALISLGFSMDELRGPEFSISVDDLRGRQCRIVIENAFGVMGTTARVKQVMPPRIDRTQDSSEFSLDL